MIRVNQYQERVDSFHIFRRMYISKYGEDLPRITFNLDDKGSTAWPVKEHSMTYSCLHPERKDFCGPDWTFIHWPSSKIESSEVAFSEIMKAGELEPKTNKAAWHGNILSAGPDRPENKTRPMLVNEIAKRHPEKFHFLNAGPGAGLSFYVPMQEMVAEHKYLLDIGGNGYSGRLKFLLFSGRPLLLVDREYIEYFNEDLRAWEHYVPVRTDLSDIVEKYNWLRDNETEAKRIGEQAKEFAIQNFTSEKILERLRFAALNCHRANFQ